MAPVSIPASTRVSMASSYSAAPVIAFWNMLGLEVSPQIPSSSIIFFSAPDVSIPRPISSYQTLCPCLLISLIGLSPIATIAPVYGIDWSDGSNGRQPDQRDQQTRAERLV